MREPSRSKLIARRARTLSPPEPQGTLTHRGGSEDAAIGSATETLTTRIPRLLLGVTCPRLEWSALHWIAVRREAINFGSSFRQAIRVLLLLKLDQFLPHQTA
jgi:hypothetical protein